jgi:hypothetical protein
LAAPARRDNNLGPVATGRPGKAWGHRFVNLALDDHPEALADEVTLLAEEGIAYTHIPVPFDAPTRKHLDTLRDVIDAAKGPVHVHCIMNWRVSAFMYLLDLENGVPEAEARARMTRVWDPLTSDEPATQPWKKLLNP